MAQMRWRDSKLHWNHIGLIPTWWWTVARRHHGSRNCTIMDLHGNTWHFLRKNDHDMHICLHPSIMVANSTGASGVSSVFGLGKHAVTFWKVQALSAIPEMGLLFNKATIIKVPVANIWLSAIGLQLSMRKCSGLRQETNLNTWICRNKSEETNQQTNLNKWIWRKSEKRIWRNKSEEPNLNKQMWSKQIWANKYEQTKNKS